MALLQEQPLPATTGVEGCETMTEKHFAPCFDAVRKRRPSRSPSSAAYLASCCHTTARQNARDAHLALGGASLVFGCPATLACGRSWLPPRQDPWPRRSRGDRPKAITLAPGCAAFNAGARMAGVYACGSGTTGAPEEQQALCTGEDAGATHISCQQGPPMRAQERRRPLQGLQLAPRGQVWTRACVRAVGEAPAAKLSFCAVRPAKRSGSRRVAEERREGRRPARGAQEAPAARGLLLAGTRLVQSQSESE
jgi:hypothetical protein